MKKFETPAIEIEKYNVTDVITTSFDCDGYVVCSDETALD